MRACKIFMNNTIIYTDGSSRGNPGPGGWGSVVISGSAVAELGGREAMTTNNRMELMAAIEGLGSVSSENPITLYSDSQYGLEEFSKETRFES
jgi:ribonuclease HI